MRIKRRIREKLLVLLLAAAAVLVLTVVASGLSSRAEDHDTKKEAMQENAAEEAAKTAEKAEGFVSSMEEDKTETVYVKADAAGEVRKITVEATLKCEEDETEILDVSDLSDIRNTKGEEEYTKKPDGTLIWENHGEDIHYKGKSDKELPVTVQISYYLDGNLIAPEKLAGESGRVKIRLDYENHTLETIESEGKEEAVPVPFLAVSALLLPEDTFSHVEVTNGKLISMDGQSMVIGYAYPGLADSLELSSYKPTEDLELPDYVEITAETSEFELTFTATVITAGSLEDLDTEKLDDLEELTDAMEELTDASRELADGTGELLDGMEEFQGYLEEYADGADALNDGARALRDGLFALNTEKVKLAEGAAALQSGLEALEQSLAALEMTIDSSLAETSMTEEEKTAVKESILAGINGNGQLQTLKTGSQQLTQGVTAFNEGIETLYQGSVELKKGTREFVDAGTELQDGFGEVVDAVREMKEGVQEFEEEGIQKLGDLAGEELETIIMRLRALKEADGRYCSFSGLREGKTGSVKFILETDGIEK